MTSAFQYLKPIAVYLPPRVRKLQSVVTDQKLNHTKRCVLKLITGDDHFTMSYVSKVSGADSFESGDKFSDKKFKTDNDKELTPEEEKKLLDTLQNLADKLIKQQLEQNRKKQKIPQSVKEEGEEEEEETPTK